MIWIAVIIPVVIFLLISIVIMCMRALDRRKIREIEKLDQRGVRYMDYANYNKALTEYEQAVKQAEALSLNNWQYIEEKENYRKRLRTEKRFLHCIKEAEAAFLAGEYEQALKLYEQIQKEAVYQGFDSLSADAEERQRRLQPDCRLCSIFPWGYVPLYRGL